MRGDDDFIRQYAPFVARVVNYTQKQLGLTEDLDDLKGYAYEGLLEARRDYRPEEGTPFQQFAHYRVRGAIVDGLRAMGKLKRRAHARLVAAQAGDTLAERRLLAGLHKTNDPEQAMRTIDEVIGGMATAYYAALAGERSDEDDSPEAVLLARERAALLEAAVARLSEPQRRLVEGHHVGGRPLDALIGELGYSRSWGREVYSGAIKMLRQALTAA